MFRAVYFASFVCRLHCSTTPLQIQPLQQDWQKAMPKGSVSNSVMCNLIRLLCLSLSLVFSHKPYGNPSKQTTAWFTKRLCINGMPCMLPCINGTHTALRAALMDGPLSSIFIKEKHGVGLSSLPVLL